MVVVPFFENEMMFISREFDSNYDNERALHQGIFFHYFMCRMVAYFYEKLHIL
jgi:hypothetical protein